MANPRYEIIEDDEKPTSRYELIDEEAKKPEMVSTFLGKMPSNIPELKIGTPENKATLKELIEGMAMTPTAGLYAGVKDPLMQLLGKAGRGIMNTVKTARTDISPIEQGAAQAIGQAEEKALQAGEKAGIAEKEAIEPNPGLYEKPMTDLEKIEHEIGKHVNIEQTHDVAASSAITNRVKAIEDFWKDSFQQLENKLGDAKFQMPEEAMQNLSYDTNEIMRRLQKGANPKTVVKEIEAEKAAAQNPYYKDLISHAPTSADVSAKDFLSKYRDFRDALGGLKQDLKSESILSGEKLKIKDAIEKGKEVQNQIKDALNEGLGEFKEEFRWVNKGYAEQVFPLRKNPIVKAAAKGKLPKNMAEALRTNEPGMPLMRDIVRQDPELLRNVVGQRYKLRPSDIHHPDALLREYLDEMPQFKRLIKEKESILQQTAKRKDISLKEKMQAEKELKEIRQAKEKEIMEAKKARKKAKGKLVKGALYTGGGIATSLGVPYGVNKIAKLFTGD